MKPLGAIATQRPDLASLIDFDAEGSWGGFIGLRVMPLITVTRQAGTFGRIRDEDLIKYVTVVDRAPDGGYSRNVTDFDDDSYSCEEKGHEEKVDDRESRMFQDYGDAEQIATTRCVDVILRAMEVSIAAAATSGVSTTAVSNGVWTLSTSTPVADIKAAKKEVRDATGILPDTLALDWEGWQALINNPQIVDRVKYQGFVDARAGALTRGAVAVALDLAQVLVAGDATLKRSSATAFTQIWDRTKAWLFKSPMSNDIKEPCLGRTFHWADGDEDFAGYPAIVETYRDESVRGTIVRARHDVHHKQLYAASARVITGILA